MQLPDGMGPSSHARGLDCRAPGHGGGPAGPPQLHGGVSPRPVHVGEGDLVQVLFLEGILWTLSNVLRPTEGAGAVGGHAREGVLEDS